jgi:Carboxypeptidase regulatory-like domain
MSINSSREVSMRLRRPRFVLSLVCLVAAGALIAGAAAADYAVSPPANGGTISGRVTFDGPVPEIASVPATKNPEVCGDSVPDPNATVVDPKTHGIEWVLLSLDGVAQGKAPADQYALANQGCAFHPHVLGAMQRKTFVLENKDAVIHNTHIRLEQGGRTLLNDALSFHEGDAMYHPIEDHRVLLHDGMLKVNCDVHNWMSGYVAVMTNPYFAVTGADGSFAITDVPPGTYTVKVWHENLGEKTEQVTVTAGATATLDVTFSKP